MTSMVLFKRYVHFFSTAKLGDLRQEAPIPSMKYLYCSNISFKSNGLLREKKVLGFPASTPDGVLLRDIWVSSHQFNKPIWRNRAFLPLENLEFH
jgi:hypothetical protein